MLLLRRVFIDGPDRPELVLLHYAAGSEDSPGAAAARGSLIVPSTAEAGRREARLFLPDPPPGRRLRVRYFFSTVRGGAEWFSPAYDLSVPGEETAGDLSAVEEAAGGNLRPAPGCGMFRLLLPLREGEPRTGTVRFGFGAMRKKPSAELCRAALPLDGAAPVVEAPEALSVLKNRPMPYFLYHITDERTGLVADKINCARLTLKDEEGDVVCARLIWADPSWTARNITVMEVRNYASPEGRAKDYFFAENREAFLAERSEELAGHPVPRTFEAFVFGAAGSVVEYCFQVLKRRPDRSVAAAWRNRDGRNWTVTL
ncbi:MAG: hypothetical protein HZA60_08045 [Deltaproteobacteria bacterium]|nr:hypothetical protein [Deltaproteobacteria bacterium]